MTVALAVSAGLAADGGTLEDRLLVSAFGRRGVDARLESWDGDADWAGFDGVLIRSCWDYHLRPDEFRAWLDRLETLAVPVWNPPALVRWNIDKRYLLDLAGRGVPVVPTLVRDEIVARDLAPLSERLTADQLVVKPVVGATAHGCRRLAVDVASSVDEVLAPEREGPWLVQPFIESIVTRGEWSLMAFDGRLDYAVRKLPAAGDYRVQPEWGGSSRREAPDEALVAACRRTLAALEGKPLYARVDLVDWNDAPHLMELELIEPQLYLEPEDEGLDTLIGRFS